MISFALPKGRLGETIVSKLKSAGLAGDEALAEGRKLVSESGGIRFFWVKPADVAVYVERGVADIGAIGRDILLEDNPDVYELADLRLGKCRMCVIGKEELPSAGNKPIRVATKFPNIAKEHFGSAAQIVDIIKLNGSIELAPILGLSDIIVDLVETGNTIKANGLLILERIYDISTWFIANKVAYKFKNSEITRICEKLEQSI